MPLRRLTGSEVVTQQVWEISQVLDLGGLVLRSGVGAVEVDSVKTCGAGGEDVKVIAVTDMHDAGGNGHQLFAHVVVGTRIWFCKSDRVRTEQGSCSLTETDGCQLGALLLIGPVGQHRDGQPGIL